MRLNSLDHLRGFGIILVIVFSLWPFMYFAAPEFSLLVHNQPGKFSFGDMIFPLFLFCSGVSVYLYHRKLCTRGGKLVDAERKYLNLAIVSLAISATHLFTIFPDEVTLIAFCDILLFNLLWHRVKPSLLAAYCVLTPLILIALLSIFPQQLSPLSSIYLGGPFALPYYLAVAICGALFAADAFPSGSFDAKRTIKAAEKWVLLLSAVSVLSSLIFPIDKMNLSPSFLPVAALFSVSFFWLFLHLFELRRIKIHFLQIIGAHSLWGWALLFIFSAFIWLLNLRGNFNPAIYLPLCALLLLLLYAALSLLEKIRKK